MVRAVLSAALFAVASRAGASERLPRDRTDADITDPMVSVRVARAGRS